MVILDTSIIIEHLRSTAKKGTILMQVAQKMARENLAISIITVQELYEGQSTKEKEKENYLLATITPLKILSYTYEIAQLAGEIARDLQKPIEFADAAIAATAIVNGASLLTLNTKDFLGIQELELYSLAKK
ncbi:MAG: PIN domain-containing protein [Candidatus Portnoybacteria bacterium]|nr:PIN domain-containing protein [Candidatus Portnoybacteria bacterium]